MAPTATLSPTGRWRYWSDHIAGSDDDAEEEEEEEDDDDDDADDDDDKEAVALGGVATAGVSTDIADTASVGGVSASVDGGWWVDASDENAAECDEATFDDARDVVGATTCVSTSM